MTNPQRQVLQVNYAPPPQHGITAHVEMGRKVVFKLAGGRSSPKEKDA
jgi:hypothetical protein